MKIRTGLALAFSMMFLASCATTQQSVSNKPIKAEKPFSEAISPFLVLSKNTWVQKQLSKLGSKSELYEDYKKTSGLLVIANTRASSATKSMLQIFDSNEVLQKEALSKISTNVDLNKIIYKGQTAAGILIETIGAKTVKMKSRFGTAPGLSVQYSIFYNFPNPSDKMLADHLSNRKNNKTIYATVDYLIKNDNDSLMPVVYEYMEQPLLYSYRVHKRYVEWVIDSLIKQDKVKEIREMQKLLKFYNVKFDNRSKELLDDTLRKIEKYLLLK